MAGPMLFEPLQPEGRGGRRAPIISRIRSFPLHLQDDGNEIIAIADRNRSIDDRCCPLHIAITSQWTSSACGHDPTLQSKAPERIVRLRLRSGAMRVLTGGFEQHPVLEFLETNAWSAKFTVFSSSLSIGGLSWPIPSRSPGRDERRPGVRQRNRFVRAKLLLYFRPRSTWSY